MISGAQRVVIYNGERPRALVVGNDQALIQRSGVTTAVAKAP